MKLTTTEAAERLGVTDAYIRQLILRGELPAEKFGRAHVIDEADLERFKDAPKVGRPRTHAPKPKRAGRSRSKK